jgi:hypothetical protein
MKRIARGGEAVRLSAEESRDLRIALDRLRDEDDEIISSSDMKKMLESCTGSGRAKNRIP